MYKQLVLLMEEILHHLTYKNPVKNGKNYLPQLVSRISSINSIQGNFLKYPNGVSPGLWKGGPTIFGGVQGPKSGRVSEKNWIAFRDFPFTPIHL